MHAYSRFANSLIKPLLVSMTGCFVTGTDTGVGKTLITAALAHCLKQRGLRVAVMKPIETGCPDEPQSNSDAERLTASISDSSPIDLISPYRFTSPVAPLTASRAAGPLLIWVELPPPSAHGSRAGCRLGGGGGWSHGACFRQDGCSRCHRVAPSTCIDRWTRRLGRREFMPSSLWKLSGNERSRLSPLRSIRLRRIRIQIKFSRRSI